MVFKNVTGLKSLAILVLSLMAAPSWGDDGRSSDPITFTDQIAPIIFNNCTECHRPGQAAPFPFTTYQEVRKRGRMIVAVTSSGYMPPWHPETFGALPLKDQRVLSDEQVDLLAQWVEDGMPEGDPSLLPTMPEFPEGWRLGTPDLVITMAEAFPVPADGPDIYRNFVLPINLPEDRWVKAVEIRPSAREVVHHALFFLGESQSARQRDAADPLPGFEGMGVARHGSLGGWAVGAEPRLLPDDLALKLPAGTDLVMQTHFHPSGKPESESTTVGIYFADGPPSRTLHTLQLPPRFGVRHLGIIRAGDSEHIVTDSYTTDREIELIGVGAHAHYLATDIRAKATLPDGTEELLFWIPAWDFNWQGRYEFAEPVTLPAGTQIDVSLVYDNSEGNLNNPTIPPVDVRWGLESTDEMGSITFSYLSVGSDRPLKSPSSGIGRSIADRLSQQLRTQDRDGDGKLSREEVPAYLNRIFARLDTDNDNLLSLEEIRPFLNRLRGETRDQN